MFARKPGKGITLEMYIKNTQVNKKKKRVLTVKSWGTEFASCYPCNKLGFLHTLITLALIYMRELNSPALLSASIAEKKKDPGLGRVPAQKFIWRVIQEDNWQSFLTPRAWSLLSTYVCLHILPQACTDTHTCTQICTYIHTHTHEKICFI